MSHHHQGEGHPHRSKRFFAHGDLRLVVLDILSRNASHGYELIKEIEAMTLGHYSPSAGVIYPTLDYLQQQNFISVREGELGRKEIVITDNGRFWLEEQRSALQQIKQRIQARTVGHQLRKDPAMKQALDNIKGALDQKVNRENADRQMLERIIAILNRASKEILSLDEKN